VTFQGKDLSELPAHARYALGWAYVSAERRIVAGLTVRENIHLGPAYVTTEPTRVPSVRRHEEGRRHWNWPCASPIAPTSSIKDMLAHPEIQERYCAM
jgi:hypothetical protein